MSEITTVGLDLAKNVFNCTAQTRLGGLCGAVSCGGDRFSRSRPVCRVAQWRWRPVVELTTGAGRSGGWVMRSG